MAGVCTLLSAILVTNKEKKTQGKKIRQQTIDLTLLTLKEILVPEISKIQYNQNKTQNYNKVNADSGAQSDDNKIR